METIRNRVDQFGVSEPDIRPQGDNRIIIQLPGVEDPIRKAVKKLIGRTALLEFKLVDERPFPPGKGFGRTACRPGTEIAYEIVTDPEIGRHQKNSLPAAQADPDDRRIRDRRPGGHRQPVQHGPYVSLNFDAKGARLFERITEANVNKTAGHRPGRRVNSAPVHSGKDRAAGGLRSRAATPWKKPATWPWSCVRRRPARAGGASWKNGPWARPWARIPSTRASIRFIVGLVAWFCSSCSCTTALSGVIADVALLP